MRNMNEVDRKRIEWFVAWLIEKAVGSDYVRDIIEHNGFMEDVIADVIECSAWNDEGYYNEDDVRLAIGRVFIDRLGINN